MRSPLLQNYKNIFLYEIEILEFNWIDSVVLNSIFIFTRIFSLLTLVVPCSCNTWQTKIDGSNLIQTQKLRVSLLLTVQIALYPNK